eukprot:19247_1
MYQSDTMADHDIQLLFQTFNKKAKRKEKTKWWKNLEHLVNNQESKVSTDILGDDQDTLTGIINAFQELSRVNKPDSDTSRNRALSLFQCLFRVTITDQCAKRNGIASFIKAIHSASRTFANNEECMEILVSWVHEWLSTSHTGDDDIVLMPHLASLSALLLPIALNDDFVFVLQREAALVCELFLNDVSFDDLKSFLDDGVVRNIGATIQCCGDWYLQYLLLLWMSAYYMNCKLCVHEKASSTRLLSKIETAFYGGLFDDIKSAEVEGSKQGIKDKMNESLFYLTRSEYNATYNSKTDIVSHILSHYNKAIYPNNSVWTVNIVKSWIYRADADEESVGAFKLHLGDRLVYIQFEDGDIPNITALWNGICKFERNEETLSGRIHFTDCKEQETNGVERVTFQSDNHDDFETLTSDIVNNLPKTAIVCTQKHMECTNKATKETNETTETVTSNTHSKRKRRRSRRKSKTKQTNEMEKQNETEQKQDEMEEKQDEVIVHHIVSSTENVADIESHEIDMNQVETDPLVNENEDEHKREDIPNKTDTIETHPINDVPEAMETETHKQDQIMDIDEQEVLDKDVKEATDKKQPVILVPDSDPSQANTEEPEFVSRPLMHPVQGPLPLEAPYETPRKTRPISLMPTSSPTKRKRSTNKWRKRPPLRLESARNKNKKQNETLPLQQINDVVNDDRFHENNGRKRKHFDAYDKNENVNPPTKKRKTVVMEDKQTQTEAKGLLHVDVNKIENQISSRFKILFENLFRDKCEELRNDNDGFRQFLRGKASETNDIQNDYNAKMKHVQSEIFNQFRENILKKWKDDAMDVCEQLDEYATNIQSQNRVAAMGRSDSSDDIVLQIKSLLNNYNQN